MAPILIGTSGWVYPHWRARFYPSRLPQTRWLEFYARHYPTVEVNNTFYRLPSKEVFISWRERTPGEFVFTIKASRFITHIKRLRDAPPALKMFMERAVHLQPKLGPILFQLPPRFSIDLELLETFLRALPDTIRPVLEFRDPSWHVQPVYDLLDRYGAAYCIMVSPKLKCELQVTSRLLYIRFHAPRGIGPSFGRRRLQEWSARIAALMQNSDEGWVYFNNDAQGAAIEDANVLRDLLSRGAPAGTRSGAS